MGLVTLSCGEHVVCYLILFFTFPMAHHVSGLICGMDFVGWVMFLGGCLGHWWGTCVGIIVAGWSMPLAFLGCLGVWGMTT